MKQQNDNRLNKLEERIRSAKVKIQKNENTDTPPNSKLIGLGMRVALEMLAAIGVSGLIGWYIDKFLDSKPWFFLVFLLLGIAAGLKSVFKVIRIIEKEEKNK